MFQLTKKQDKYLKYEFKNVEHGSWLTVIPERGGIITSMGIENREILYLDEKSLYQEKYIRGGIPILFPICGRLENQKYSWNEQNYNMEIHGLARNYPWEVITCESNDEAVIKLKLTSNDDTKKQYPFDFELIYTYILKENKLRIEQSYINSSTEEMPFYAGFHPYFKVAEKEKLEFNFDCTKYLECDDMSVRAVSEIDMTGDSDGKILLDMKESDLSFYDPELKHEIKMIYSQDFKYVVLWSLSEQDFICVEPWTAKPNAFNTKEDLLLIEPGETFNEHLDIVVNIK